MQPRDKYSVCYLTFFKLLTFWSCNMKTFRVEIPTDTCLNPNAEMVLILVNPKKGSLIHSNIVHQNWLKC